MVEHTAVNRGVVGSSPTRGAKNSMATWPSGKAKVCNTSITSSNLVGTSSGRLKDTLRSSFCLQECDIASEREGMR